MSRLGWPSLGSRVHDFSFMDSFSILAECVSGVRVQRDCKSCQTTEEGNVATQSTSDTNGKVNAWPNVWFGCDEEQM